MLKKQNTMLYLEEKNSLEPPVSLPALPARHQVQQMHTFRCLALVLARLARKLDVENGENRKPCAFVALSHQRCVEVNLRREGRDGQKASGVNGQQRRHGLVEEPGVHVGSLL
jgi:hypothetical protein